MIASVRFGKCGRAEQQENDLGLVFASVRRIHFDILVAIVR